jgi:ABC-type sugar transport system permease subunit
MHDGSPVTSNQQAASAHEPAATESAGGQPAHATTRTVLTMVLAGLAVRLLVIPFTYPDHLDPQRHHWRFAWEMGMVARSIVTGKGFSSPYVGDTGPTAWFPPLYPYLLAGVFKVFGLFTKASAIAILSLALFGPGPVALVMFPLMGFAASVMWPIIFSLAEDALTSVPHSMTAASMALGASRWQTVWGVVLPSASTVWPRRSS